MTDGIEAISSVEQAAYEAGVADAWQVACDAKPEDAALRYLAILEDTDPSPRLMEAINAVRETITERQDATAWDGLYGSPVPTAPRSVSSTGAGREER